MNPLEILSIRSAWAPIDNNSAAQTGDYFSMVDHEDVLILCHFGDGTASQDLDLLVYQAQDASGTGAAVLNCLQTGRIFTMYAADAASLAALTGWTKVTQATADEEYDSTDNGESVGFVALWVRASDLTDGFTHIRVDSQDPGAAKIAGCIYIGLNPKFPAGATVTQDPLV